MKVVVGVLYRKIIKIRFNCKCRQLLLKQLIRAYLENEKKMFTRIIEV